MSKQNQVILFITFHILLTIFSIYLSYKVNYDTYDPKSIILAIIAPYIYIFYMYKKENDILMLAIDYVLYNK